MRQNRMVEVPSEGARRKDGIEVKEVEDEVKSREKGFEERCQHSNGTWCRISARGTRLKAGEALRKGKRCLHIPDTAVTA